MQTNVVSTILMIAHLVLNVSNFSKSEGFYDRLLFRLGYSVNHREETTEYAVKSYGQAGHAIWVKCERIAVCQPFVRNVGLDHLAFKAESKSKVNMIFEELREAGVVITREPALYPEYSPVYYAFYFRDPDGVPLEVAFY